MEHRAIWSILPTMLTVNCSLCGRKRLDVATVIYPSDAAAAIAEPDKGQDDKYVRICCDCLSRINEFAKENYD